MRLTVKQNGKAVQQFQFNKGPIYIGRRPDSHVFLPNRSVSRQHAVIFDTQDGKWIVEDLNSANKTYLNNQPVNKTEIKTGDVLRVLDFTIDIDLEQKADNERQADEAHLEDTLITAYHQPQTITRRVDAEHAPEIMLPARRARDFVEATEAICSAKGMDELVQVLLRITAKQFNAFHSWCALRNQPSGAMTFHGGRKRTGQTVQFNDVKLQDKISQAVEDRQFLLFPRITTQIGEERIKSAMIAPVTGKSGCMGVIYVDNDAGHESYALSDLDYLMLLAIHTAAIVENF